MAKALSKDKAGSVCVSACAHVHVRVHLLVSAHRGGHFTNAKSLLYCCMTSLDLKYY